MTVLERLLVISPELSLPAAAVLTDSTAIVGRKRVGKSNTAAVIVEEALDLGAQVVIFDPKGDWWGLRSSADGESAGYPVVVIGGQHSMLPLNPLAGVAVADWIIDTGHSVVLDISDLEPADCERFCSDLLRQLRKRKKAKPGTILLVFDEADELAPQDTRFGSAFLKTLGLVIWMVKRGGFLGIGTVVVTQRAASLNKNVLTQTELFIAMQTTGTQDIDAEQGWFKHQMSKADLSEFLAGIAKLDKGEAFVASGQILKGTVRIRIRRRRTFDSGATPEMGELAHEPKVVADVDLQQLNDAMAAAVEEVKRTDPEILRNRIRELEKALSGAVPHTPEVVTRVEQERVEIPVLANGALEDLKQISSQWVDASRLMLEAEQVARDRAESIRSMASDFGRAVELVAVELDRIAPDPALSRPAPSDGNTVGAGRVRAATHAAASPSGTPMAEHGKGAAPPRRTSDTPRSGEPRVTTDVDASQQKILDGIALLEHRGADVTPVSIAKIIGLHENGGRYRGNLKALFAGGFIRDDYRLTDSGRAIASVEDKISETQKAIIDVVRELEAVGVEPKVTVIASWLDKNPNGGRFRGDLKHLQTTGILDGYGLTRAGRAHAGVPVGGLGAAYGRLDPSTSRLLQLVVESGTKGLTVTAAAGKLNLHPNGGRFRSSIGRLYEMGVLKSKSELALTDAFREERR